MKNDDRAEVLRGKARVLTYSDIMNIVRRAVELDDGGSTHSEDGWSWNPDCYLTHQDRINQAGACLGRILFADGGCSAAAFEVFLPSFNEALRGLLNYNGLTAVA